MLAHFVRFGYEVYLPVFGNGPVDLIAYRDGVYLKVEVKSTSYRKGISYEVQLRSVRHNSNEIKSRKFSSTGVDVLAVYIVPEDRVVTLKASKFEGRTSVMINAQK